MTQVLFYLFYLAADYFGFLVTKQYTEIVTFLGIITSHHKNVSLENMIA